jgi:hypothetical protein
VSKAVNTVATVPRLAPMNVRKAPSGISQSAIFARNVAQVSRNSRLHSVAHLARLHPSGFWLAEEADEGLVVAGPQYLGGLTVRLAVHVRDLEPDPFRLVVVDGKRMVDVAVDEPFRDVLRPVVVAVRSLACSSMRAYCSPIRRLRPHAPRSSAVMVLSTGLIAPMANFDAERTAQLRLDKVLGALLAGVRHKPSADERPDSTLLPGELVAQLRDVVALHGRHRCGGERVSAANADSSAKSGAEPFFLLIGPSPASD